MRLRSRIAALGVAGALALTLAGCGGATASQGTVAIGIRIDQPGLGEQDGSTFRGLDVDVARYVARELGYTGDAVRFTNTPPDQAGSAIETGQVTLVVAAYAITDDRSRQVSFAGPYFVAGQDLLVAADDTAITGPDAMNGKNLCSVPGSGAAKRVKDRYASSVKLVEQDSYRTCVDALVEGTVDAVTADNAVLAGLAAQRQYADQVKVVGKPFSTVSYGVGLKKGDVALCTKVNAALEKMVSDGSWQKAVTANLGASGFAFDPTTNPPKPGPCV